MYSIIGIIILVIVTLISLILIKHHKKSKEQAIFKQSKTVKPVVAYQGQASQAQYPQIRQTQGVMFQPETIVQPLQLPQSQPQPQIQQIPPQFPSQQLPIASQPPQNNKSYNCYHCKKYH